MAYQRVNWENSPSTSTPLSAENLNQMDKGIEDAHLAIVDCFTKEESKSRFGLTVSAIYDENNILLQWRSGSSLGGGLFSGTNAKTAFIANDVVTIQSGAFIRCTNLETVYIDKPIEDLQQGRFYIQDGAFPPTVNIIYTDSFNAVTANAKAIAELNRKYNNSNTDTNIESGTGDLTNLNSNISIRYAMHSYQRVDNFVTLRIRVCVQANHLSGDLIFSGLPFNTQKYFYGVCISDLNNICKWTIGSTGLQISKSDSSSWIHGTTEEFTFVATYEI